MATRHCKVTVASTDYLFPLKPFTRNDRTQYYVKQSSRVGLPDAVPTSGQPTNENLVVRKEVTFKAPFRVGHKNIQVPNGIWDEESNSLFTKIYPPPLQTSTTKPGGTQRVEFNNFTHAIGELFAWGDGLSPSTTADFQLIYATAIAGAITWADSTLQADLGASLTTPVTGLVEHKGNTFGLIRDPETLQTVASQQVFMSIAGVKTDWQIVPDGLGTGVTAPGANSYWLDSDGTNLYTTTGTTSIAVKKSANDGVTFPTTLATINASGHARGMAMFSDGTSVEDVWITTPEGLYQIDISATTFKKHVSFSNQQSANTGKLFKAFQGLLFTDGHSLYFGYWATSVFFTWVLLGLDNILPDGQPLAKEGDITSISYIPELAWVAVTVGGGDASHNGTVYIYKLGLAWSRSFAADSIYWNCIYKNSTANKQAFASAFSYEPDGIGRLHISEDNATAGDSTLTCFDYIHENPETQTSYKFASTGQVTMTSHNADMPSFQKAYEKFRINVSGLDTQANNNEKVTVKFAYDGGSLDSGQTIYSDTDPQSVWMDGAASAVGKDAKSVVTELTLARGATTTNAPKVADFSYAYQVVVLKDDKTPLRAWQMLISLDKADYPNIADPTVADPKTARAALDTILKNRPLVKLTLGNDVSAVKVRMQPYMIERSIGLSGSEEGFAAEDDGGAVLVEFAEEV